MKTERFRAAKLKQAEAEHEMAMAQVKYAAAILSGEGKDEATAAWKKALVKALFAPSPLMELIEENRD